MKLKQGIFFAALFGMPVMASAQENLVDNGGFESVTGKIKKTGQIDLATGWKSPTGARADLFMSDTKVADVGAPANIYGNEQPKEGENYAGFMAFSYGDKLPRSYVSAKLNSPLKKDMKYCVQFYVSLADGSKYSANQIGANFSKKEFGTAEKSAIIEETHVKHAKNNILNATYGWELVCGTYIAKGDEKYINIGNFTSNENTKNERNKKIDTWKGSQFVGAYYFLDNVSVTLIGDGVVCDCGIDTDKNTISTMIYQRGVVLDAKATPKQKIEAQTTYFAFGKDRITQQGQAALDVVVAEMKANPALNIVLVAHSDAEEDKLAETKPVYANSDKNRGVAVKEYLKSKGIDAQRITIENKSSVTPNAKEISESDSDELKMAKNRRVEILVK